MIRKKLYISGIIVFFLISIVILLLYSPKKINKDIDIFLNDIGIRKSCIIYYSGFDKIQKETFVYSLTNKEKEHAITEYLNDNIYRRKIQNRKIICFDDLVVTDYDIYYHSKRISSAKDEPIKIGSGYYDNQLERKLIGLKIYERYSLEWTAPNDYYNELYAGKTLEIKIFPRELYMVIVPTLEEMSQKKGLANSFVLEQSIIEDYLEKKRYMIVLEHIDHIIDEIIMDCKFIIDEDEAIENAVDYYYEYMDISDVNSMSMHNNLSNNEIYNDDIYIQCYNLSVEEIKRYLTIGAIAKNITIDVSNDHFNEYLNEQNISQDIDRNEAEYLKYLYIESQVYKYIEDNFITVIVQ